MAEHPESHRCTPGNGPRAAGKPTECFYCGALLGNDHLADCACRVRSVVIRATIEYAVLVSESWDESDILFHRNESSSCQSNLLGELEHLAEVGDCLCGRVRFEVVREATAEDEVRDGVANLLREHMGEDARPGLDDATSGHDVLRELVPVVKARAAELVPMVEAKIIGKCVDVTGAQIVNINGADFEIPSGTRYIKLRLDGRGAADAVTGESLKRLGEEAPDGEV